MKIIAIFSASLISFTSISSALAADVVAAPMEAPAPFYNESYYYFTGAYAGIQVGGNWFRQHVSLAGEDFSKNFAKADGFSGGIYAGYNNQLSNNLVVGVDTDFNSGDVSGTKALGTDNNSFKQNWSGATRFRIGYAANKIMPYFSVGVAYAGITNKLYSVIGVRGVSVSGKESRLGYTVGAGVEYALLENMLLRVEYRYNNYGKVQYASNVGDLKMDYYSNEFRAGIAYKF